MFAPGIMVMTPDVHDIMTQTGAGRARSIDGSSRMMRSCAQSVHGNKGDDRAP